VKSQGSNRAVRRPGRPGVLGLHSRRAEFGDWQTPSALAADVLRVVQRRSPSPATVLEPTCGHGTFLDAARSTFPLAHLVGFDVSEEYVARARESLLGTNARLEVADFFQLNWEDIVRQLPEPLLIIGNPPWVTNSTLGKIAATNLPPKANFKGHSGLDAMTGKSNFDISEWMLLRLLLAAQGRSFFLAMLCKSTVARRLMSHSASKCWRVNGAVYAIDAKTHFAAAVDAVLLTVEPESEGRRRNRSVRWAVFSELGAQAPVRWMGVVDGKTCSDIERCEVTRDLEGTSEVEWRSGMKHDCSRVMELAVVGDAFINGSGEQVHLEPEFVYPLLKGSDVANGRMRSDRRVIVPQRILGEDTSVIRLRAPDTWRYLCTNKEHLDARKSTIYRGQPSFAIFGVGDYSFAPYKVAICGLYKRLVFALVEPIDGRPVMLDDTSYFLPCETREEAAALAKVLNSARAREFFEARVFWDAKRPVSKALLQSLSLVALQGLRPAVLPVRTR